MIVIATLSAAAIFLQTADSMALLRTGSPLDWSQAKPFLNGVRISGVKQFLHHYKRVRDVQTPLPLWGDELEYGIFAYNNASKAFDLSLRGTEIREELLSSENQYNGNSIGCSWQPEYGAWMVEAVPRDPYGADTCDLLLVEESMRLRRTRLRSALRPNEVAPSLSLFPMLGAEGYEHTSPSRGDVSNSESVSDAIINPHPRFGALTRNIRMRRGRNVHIRMPIEEGAATSVTRGGTAAAVDDDDDAASIKMDAMAFGMGCCCLQVTMQCQNETQSRFIHDQMAVLAPLFLALSAATPAIAGRLRNTDTRWDLISQSVDDRRASESGEGPAGAADVDLAGGGVRALSKSRYSSVCRYIAKAESEEHRLLIEKLNDVDAGCDDEVLSLMLSSGVDSSLSQHLAYLFTRDPLVIFDDAINVDDTKTLEHFENIQSTNWQSVRWKTPAVETGIEIEGLADGSGEGRKEQIQSIVDGKPGWRVEFRPLEIQLSDFDNAAFAVAIVLAIRAILSSGVDFYIPMSMNEENFRRAQKKDAVLTEKFFVKSSDGGAEEMTLDAFFNGPTAQGTSHTRFSGLLPLVRAYLLRQRCGAAVVDRIAPYLELIGDKASGRAPTTARMIRGFIKGHKDYRSDGRISDVICNDLLVLAEDINANASGR